MTAAGRFTMPALYGARIWTSRQCCVWFTAKLGVHVHHLHRVPFYRLPEVLRAYPHLNE